MSSSPLISIITPMYNAESFILETIRSAQDQSYENWEMIVVDNKSTDRSREIVKSVEDKRIALIELDCNSGGPAHPRNVAIQRARGEYIAFLDSDDVWLADKLAKQVKEFETSNFDIITTLAFTIDKDSNCIGILKNQSIRNLFKIVMKDSSIMYYSNFININSVLMKVDKTITFDEDNTLVAIEDWAYWINHFIAGKRVHVMSEYLLKYRVVSNSMSDRNSDMSFRKILFLLSNLYVKQRIRLPHYFCAHSFTLIKILIKKSSFWLCAKGLRNRC